MPNATSLPPRSALPRDVDIPVLPGAGITRYDRGGKYWRRRVLLVSPMPEPLAERRARLWMAERLRDRGYGASAG
jgi:hypothetical protein